VEDVRRPGGIVEPVAARSAEHPRVSHFLDAEARILDEPVDAALEDGFIEVGVVAVDASARPGVEQLLVALDVRRSHGGDVILAERSLGGGNGERPGVAGANAILGAERQRHGGDDDEAENRRISGAEHGTSWGSSVGRGTPNGCHIPRPSGAGVRECGKPVDSILCELVTRCATRVSE
jgi:hypothetical protein